MVLEAVYNVESAGAWPPSGAGLPASDSTLGHLYKSCLEATTQSLVQMHAFMMRENMHAYGKDHADDHAPKTMHQRPCRRGDISPFCLLTGLSCVREMQSDICQIPHKSALTLL